MPDDLLLPGIFWATDIANDLIMDAGSDLSALLADELWSLVGANSRVRRSVGEVVMASYSFWVAWNCTGTWL